MENNGSRESFKNSPGLEQLDKMRKRLLYRREQALRFYRKAGMAPLSTSDQLRYEGRAKGFLIVPDELIYSGKQLSLGEKVVWLAIFLHNWNPDQSYRVSWPGRERLAIISGKSVRQVSNYLKGLKRKNLLQTIRRLDKPSLYLLKDPPAQWMVTTKKELNALGRSKRAEQQKNTEEVRNESFAQTE